MAMPDIPMYVFTGFLESGKTKFIQETLEDERFNTGERTLLLVSRRARRNTTSRPTRTRRSTSRFWTTKTSARSC